MVESNSALRRLMQLCESQNAVLMVADQTSHGLDSDYWNEFLHQETCVRKLQFRSPLKQTDTVLMLQSANMIADALLRHMKIFRRACDAHFFSDRKKRFKSRLHFPFSSLQFSKKPALCEITREPVF